MKTVPDISCRIQSWPLKTQALSYGLFLCKNLVKLVLGFVTLFTWNVPMIFLWPPDFQTSVREILWNRCVEFGLFDFCVNLYSLRAEVSSSLSIRIAACNLPRKLLLKFGTVYIYQLSRNAASSKMMGGHGSNMAGIICPLGPNRVNWYPKTWGGTCPPGPPTSGVPGLPS